MKRVSKIDMLTVINDRRVKITPKLKATYKSLRKKGMFSIFSDDLEIAWNQMTYDEKMMLYEVAMKRKKRRKKTANKKESRRRVSRKVMLGAGKRYASLSSRVEKESPDIGLERNIRIDKPIVIVEINKKRQFVPQLEIKPVKINQNKIAGLLR